LYDPTKGYYKIPDVVQIPEVTEKARRTDYEFVFPADGGFIVRRTNSSLFLKFKTF
jgi:hypothetical protein